MAALTDDGARARADAALTRATASALRLDVRRQARASRVRRARAARLHRRTQLLRSRGIPTAWSTLRWSAPGDDLNEVLELVA